MWAGIWNIKLTISGLTVATIFQTPFLDVSDLTIYPKLDDYSTGAKCIQKWMIIAHFSIIIIWVRNLCNNYPKLDVSCLPILECNCCHLSLDVSCNRCHAKLDVSFLPKVECAFFQSGMYLLQSKIGYFLASNVGMYILSPKIQSFLSSKGGMYLL